MNRWEGIFKYDESVPSCVIRDYDVIIINQFGAESIRSRKGSHAGRMSKRGYWEASYNSFLYKMHRIVWEIHNGEIPKHMYIDHIDGDKGNNKIDNLRLVDSKLNSRNSIRKRSSTGFKGVYLYKVNGVVVAYRAGYDDLDKKKHLKYFYFRDFNNDEELTFFVACEWRIHQLQLLNLAGAGYTDRHIYGETK